MGYRVAIHIHLSMGMLVTQGPWHLVFRGSKAEQLHMERACSSGEGARISCRQTE